MQCDRSKNVIKCPKHPNEDLINDHHSGTIVCPKCGLVIVDQVIDESAEWRSFEDDTIEKSRVGNAELSFLSSSGNLETSIQPAVGNQNAFARSVFALKNRRSNDRALMAAYREISVIVSRINAPSSVVSRSMDIYEKSYEKRHLKGNVLFRDPKVAACIYIACHQEGVPRTSSEICAACEFSRYDINRWARKLMNVLRITVSPAKPCDFIPRFVSVLGMSPSIKSRAFKIAGPYNQQHMRDASSLAAAAIYVAAFQTAEKQSLDQISAALNISKESILDSGRILNGL